MKVGPSESAMSEFSAVVLVFCLTSLLTFHHGAANPQAVKPNGVLDSDVLSVHQEFLNAQRQQQLQQQQPEQPVKRSVSIPATDRPSKLQKKQAEDPDPTVQHERILKHLRDLHNLQLQHAAHQQFEDKQVEERQRVQMRQQQELEDMQSKQLTQMKRLIDQMGALIDQHMKDQKALQIAQQKERDTMRIKQQAQLREILKEKVKNKAQQEHMQRQMEVEQLKRLQQERLRLHEKEVGLEKMRLMQQGKLHEGNSHDVAKTVSEPRVEAASIAKQKMELFPDTPAASPPATPAQPRPTGAAPAADRYFQHTSNTPYTPTPVPITRMSDSSISPAGSGIDSAGFVAYSGDAIRVEGALRRTESPAASAVAAAAAQSQVQQQVDAQSDDAELVRAEAGMRVQEKGNSPAQDKQGQQQAAAAAAAAAVDNWKQSKWL